MTIIKGTKVVLRPATLTDRKQIYHWLTQSDITSKMMGPPDFNDNNIPTWEYFINDYNPNFFDDTNPDAGRSFIIEVNSIPLGQINYNEIDRKTNTVELDIWLASSKHCNKGYGTDAINALCNYLVDQLNCKVFILAPSVRNTTAVKAYKKCVFKATNVIPTGFVPDYHDTVVMVKTK